MACGAMRSETMQRLREESMERSANADHGDRVLKVISGADAASSALAASWRWSGHLHALDPASRTPSQRLPMAEIAEARERLGPLLRVAQASLDRLFVAVAGVGCSVLLADSGGVVIDRRDPMALRPKYHCRWHQSL
jgi:transcriptional regulator of acetoin/glycerol metabolism